MDTCESLHVGYVGPPYASEWESVYHMKQVASNALRYCLMLRICTAVAQRRFRSRRKWRPWRNRNVYRVS
jgi:hypothetical protein